jgi:sec-independent protein translocase protein TatC
VNTLQEAITKYSHYFEGFRRKLVLLVKIFAIVFVIAFLNAGPVIKVLLKYLTMKGVTVVTTSPFQLVEVAMSIAFFLACVVIIPICIYYLYLFLKPALFKKEQRLFLFSLPLALLLFALGFLYSVIMLYYAVRLIATVNVALGVANYWDISTFIYQIVLTSTLLGLLFMFPLVITLLIKMGATTVSFLRSKRRHAIAVIFVIVSLLPPTDGLSLILMAVPLVLIYEITVLINRKKPGRLLVN